MAGGKGGTTSRAVTMFHPNKGVFGMRVEFVSPVLIENVATTDVENTADAGHWLCGGKYRLPGTNEMVEPKYGLRRRRLGRKRARNGHGQSGRGWCAWVVKVQRQVEGRVVVVGRTLYSDTCN